MKHPRKARARLGALTLGLAFALAACAAPGGPATEGAATGGGGISGDGSDSDNAVTSPVTAEDVAALGEVTLRVLADAGEEQTLEVLIPAFEDAYPNVTVETDIKSWDDIVRTSVNMMSGSNPPDLAQGAQGYAVDGALVEAGLIRPIDDIAEVYGWVEQFGDSALAELRWSPDGKQFGTGKLYGVAPVVSMVGVYYNKQKLTELGLDVPTSAEEFETALQTAAEAGEQPLLLGNAGQGPGLHLFGLVHGQYAEPQDVRSWISGEQGTTFANPDVEAAASRLQDWAETGWLDPNANSIAEDDAVARFVGGDGVFMSGGTWLLPAFANHTDEFGFFAMPPGASGVHVAPGSLGMGWHISTQTELLPAAVAFMAMLHDAEYAQTLADLGRVPIVVDGLEPPDPLFGEAAQASATILQDSGNIHSYDWATATMFGTLGGKVQELIAGRATPAEFAEAVQADWDGFQESRG